MFLNDKIMKKITNVLNGGKVSLVCTQANLSESGAGDFNIVFREPIEEDFKGWSNGVAEYVYQCNNVVKNNASGFSKKPHGHIQTILTLEIIDIDSNKIIFDDIIDVDEYYYN